MAIKTHVGIQPEHHEEAARLYALAFERKFRKILGTPEVVVQLMKHDLNPDFAISATNDANELVGISGFQIGNQSLTSIKFKSFTNQYGFLKGTFKYLLLGVLFSRSPDKPNQLLMDGIAVKEGQRGKGIGKLLFEELQRFAEQGGFTTLKLDVIDENPDAKRLYEKIGFVATKYQSLPTFIQDLIGVSGVTTMEKELGR